MPDVIVDGTKHLRNLWDDRQAAAFAGRMLDLLCYRSNLLGADLRITNFGGGNTSSKFELPDPITGDAVRVLAVKGSGGDLRSITGSGFAILCLHKLERLIDRYRGEAHEDEMVDFYPLSAFGDNRVAASIDTPLHAFLPFAHVDHLHPDWAIALAASANGRRKLEEFNARYGRRIEWVPWQRPGFELALMLRRVVASSPACDGLLLGSHGLFTWGDTDRECYSNSIKTIDQLGEFVEAHAERARRSGRPTFGGAAVDRTADAAAGVDRAGADRESIAAAVLPYLRGRVSSNHRVIAHFEQSPDALRFANSAWAASLCRLGTSCPDHFLRTRICPMFVPWHPLREPLSALQERIEHELARYREDYVSYYRSFAEPGSPALRDANPSVVVVPGLGVFGFGQDKREARITTEFFVNAIHVMEGATALEDDNKAAEGPVPQARTREQAGEFTSFHNYVALPRREAFRIEYWALEDAKLQRRPPEREFSRKVAIIIGAASGIGREVALQLVRRGAHVVIADQNAAGAEATLTEARAVASTEMSMAVEIDLSSRRSIARALSATVLRFGGIDIVVNTAAVYPTPHAGSRPVAEPRGGPEDGGRAGEEHEAGKAGAGEMHELDESGEKGDTVWARTMHINVTSNHAIAEEVAKVLKAQNLPASIILTSSANAVVPKHGSEPYDVSKAAINHLIRELAIGLGPLIRVNGIAPATVIAGSSMFPRDRVIGSLRRYNIAFRDEDPTDALRAKLADFYAERTITRQPILPVDCANAICWLAGDLSAKTTGHIIPVDGGLPEAFFR